MTSYYVDATNGHDSDVGISSDAPWQTLAKVNGSSFSPGDNILFKMDETWTSPGTQGSPALWIDDSGEEGNPITFGAYGSGINNPTITNAGVYGSETEGITVVADWIIIENFIVGDCAAYGVAIGGDRNIVRDIEVANVGAGIGVWGQYNFVAANYIHDLKMIVNDKNGLGDWGAIGVCLYGSNNEISCNRMINCIADSHDFGVDGGAIEFYGICDNNYIHHNWAEGCDGFIEADGTSAQNCILSYNVSLNNGEFLGIHNDRVVLGGFLADNNTIVERTTSNNQLPSVLGFTLSPSPVDFLMRNNIFWIEEGTGDIKFAYICNQSGLTHEYNTYHLIGDIALGFALGVGEYEYMEHKMSVITDLQQIEAELNQQAQELIIRANSIAQIIIELQATDDLLDAAADAIEEN